jgi:hypothetical protein
MTAAHSSGSGEQMFGAKQQILPGEQSDKEAECNERVSVTLRSCSNMEHIMSKLLATAAAVLTVALCAPAFSTPANARPFCYNKYTGQFAHWGRCRVVCTYYGPGGYCRKVTW